MPSRKAGILTQTCAHLKMEAVGASYCSRTSVAIAPP
jgi:hypothetical protein